MANLDTISALKKSLCDHLKATMPSIKEVRDDFPEASENLKFPCITVFTNSPRYESLTPYVVWKGEPVSMTDLRRPVRRVVGSYEFRLQVDIWTNYKARRGPLYEEFFKALNSQVDPMGLSLKMNDYFDAWAHFHIEGFEYIDGEASAQRGEWRCKVAVVATANHIVETLENVVATIENNTEVTSGKIEPESQEDSISII